MSTQTDQQQSIAHEIILLRRLFAQVLQKLGKSATGDLTITEWCVKRGISRAQFYKLRAAGRAPRVVETGKQVRRITPEADAEWVAKYIATEVTD